jgi:hypothetical protein
LSVTNGIRPDILGIDSTNTTGGFVTHDTTNGFRLLTASEYQAGAAASFVGLGAVIQGTTSAGSATSAVVTLADATGLVVGQTLLAAVNGIPTTAKISAITGNNVTFTNATSMTVTAGSGRFNLSVLAAANMSLANSLSVQQAVTVQSLTLASGGGFGYFGGGNLT